MVLLLTNMQMDVESDDLISVIYFCRKCPYRANNVAELKAHIHKKHKNPEMNDTFIVYPCNDCAFSATSPTELRAHLLIHNKDNICIHCGITNSNKNELSSHVYSEHRFNCMECLFTCNSDKILRSHISKFHFSNVYSCSECSFTTLEEEEFMKHVAIHFAWQRNDILKHSGNNYEPTKSEVLDKNSNSKPYSCVECDFACIKEPEIRYHIKKHITKFYCKKCPYLSTDEFSYQEHKRTHIRHKCPECVEVFNDFYDLQVHSSVHNIVEKNYSCVECGLEYKHNSALKSHLLSHSDVKYVCSKCGFSSKYKRSYETHTRNNCKSKPKASNSHTKRSVKKKRQATAARLDLNGETSDLKCNNCDILFTSLDALKVHTKYGHMKEVVCEICGLQFMNKAGLASHRKFKHKNINRLCV